MAKKKPDIIEVDVQTEKTSRDRTQVDLDPEIAAKIDFITATQRVQKPGTRKISVSAWVNNRIAPLVEDEYERITRGMGLPSNKKDS